MRFWPLHIALASNDVTSSTSFSCEPNVKKLVLRTFFLEIKANGREYRLPLEALLNVSRELERERTPTTLEINCSVKAENEVLYAYVS